MTKEKFDRVMGYLDKAEEALDEIAIMTGHCSFAEWKLNEGMGV